MNAEGGANGEESGSKSPNMLQRVERAGGKALIERDFE